MPRHGLKTNFEMETRNSYTKVDTEISISIEGKELVNMAVMGAALEECIELIKACVKESYKVVPPRAETPIAEPYVNTARVES